MRKRVVVSIILALPMLAVASLGTSMPWARASNTPYMPTRPEARVAAEQNGAVRLSTISWASCLGGRREVAGPVNIECAQRIGQVLALPAFRPGLTATDVSPWNIQDNGVKTLRVYGFFRAALALVRENHDASMLAALLERALEWDEHAVGLVDLAVGLVALRGIAELDRATSVLQMPLRSRLAEQLGERVSRSRLLRAVRVECMGRQQLFPRPPHDSSVPSWLVQLGIDQRESRSIIAQQCRHATAAIENGRDVALTYDPGPFWWMHNPIGRHLLRGNSSISRHVGRVPEDGAYENFVRGTARVPLQR